LNNVRQMSESWGTAPDQTNPPGHGGAEIVDDQYARHAAKVSKGILQSAQKVVGALAVYRLAVALAAVAQHDAKHPGSLALPLRSYDGSAPAEVHLRLGSRLDFHPPKRGRHRSDQLPDQPPHAPVAAGISVVAGQILVNPLPRQPGRKLLNNHLCPGGSSTD